MKPIRKESIVPQVGKTHYSYTRKGQEQARRASKRTGKPVRNARKKK